MSNFIVDTDLRNGTRSTTEHETQSEAVAFAASMVMDKNVFWSGVRNLGQDAGRVTHTFGSRLAEANRQAQSNSGIPKEEWQRRYDKASREFEALKQEGERRKDAKGAWPKDIIRKYNALIKEMDIAKQYGNL
jgi:hypothetical protein